MNEKPLHSLLEVNKLRKENKELREKLQILKWMDLHNYIRAEKEFLGDYSYPTEEEWEKAVRDSNLEDGVKNVP